jgi:hypothetical protein
VIVIEQAFEHSPEHYANLVDPSFNFAGIAVTDTGGSLWVTEDFMYLAGLPAPAPRPTPVPSAPPAPRPTPAPRPPVPVPARPGAPVSVAPQPIAPPSGAAPARSSSTVPVPPTAATGATPPRVFLKQVLADLRSLDAGS